MSKKNKVHWHQTIEVTDKNGRVMEIRNFPDETAFILPSGETFTIEKDEMDWIISFFIDAPING